MKRFLRNLTALVDGFGIAMAYPLFILALFTAGSWAAGVGRLIKGLFS